MAVNVKSYEQKGVINYGTEENPDNRVLWTAQLECDTVADLDVLNPLDTTTFIYPSVMFVLPTTAHIIEGNKTYAMKSDGTWVIQEDPLFSGIYTKSEIDSMIDGLDDRIDAIETDFQDITYMIAKLIDSGAKNILNVWGQTSQEISGITWTINSDGTVRAQGTATANSTLYIWRNAFPPPTISESIVISGCPAGASDTTYDIAYTTNASGTISVTNPQTISQAIAATTTRLALRVYSGQNVDIVFKPMVCRYRQYQYSSDFVPYSPSNAELYQMVRALQ